MFSRTRNRKSSGYSDDGNFHPEGKSMFGRKAKDKEEAADTVSALPTGTSPGSKQPPKLDRKFSMLSQQTVDTLEGLEAQIKAMSVTADDAEKVRAIGVSPATPLPHCALSRRPGRRSQPPQRARGS